jgi:hypothetical protein
MNCKKCGQPLPVVKCQHCGKAFVQNRKDKRFCSRSCKVCSHLKNKRVGNKNEKTLAKD